MKPSDHRGKGFVGENLAAHYFASIGHKILYYKSELSGTTTRGFDIVTFKNGRVYFIDNKAFASKGRVGSVSALTANFLYNKALFEKYLQDAIASGNLPPSGKALFANALSASQGNRYLKVVTNAVFSPDEIHRTGISTKLKKLGIVFANLRK